MKYMTRSYIFYFDLEALDIVVEMYEASCPTSITCYSLLGFQTINIENVPDLTDYLALRCRKYKRVV
jgi:hypothetical protein